MSIAPRKRAIGQLAANERNPRRVTAKRARMLRESLETFGDLGCVVFNVKTQRLVGGHQRVEAFKALRADDVTIERTCEAGQSKAGTTAEGYITLGGERFPYREVCWSPETERAANLAANKAAGSWDPTLLADALAGVNLSELSLNLTMFDEAEVRSYLAQPTQQPVDARHDGPDAAAKGQPTDAPHADAPERHTATSEHDHPTPAMRQITLTFRAAEYERFVETTEALKAAYHRDNLSDTVLEALKRAAVSAAFK